MRNAKSIAVSSSCGIVSGPDEFSIKTEEYPLSRRLFLHSAATVSPLGAQLLEYALSDGAQDVISNAGFVNQRIAAQPFDQQTSWLAPALLVPDKEFNFASMRDLVNGLKGARRLSVSLHYAKASAAAAKVRQDIGRLAQYLKNEGARFREIVLAGFSDNSGAFDATRTLALNRATGFKSAIVAYGIPAEHIQVKSYGSLLPVACNTTETGRDKNRRVEVWVKE